MTEIVLRPGDEIKLRLEGGAPGAVALPLGGVLSDRGVEITRSVEPLPKARVAPNGATIGEAFTLITDPDSGKYPHKGSFQTEIARAIRFACECWGADTPFAAIEKGDWTKLLRRRLDALLAKGARGVRATEITISRLITVVTWLRDEGHVPEGAARWPKAWKAEIARQWKGTTGSVRDPEPHRPRYTLEESQRILRAADFDPRLVLLLWLGMELRLGQVARARRSDLDLTTGGDDYGTLAVHGAGKKGGTVVALTLGQRAAIDRAFGPDGYLAEKEAQRIAAVIDDYPLFPAGYTKGRVAFLRGDDSTVTLGDAVDWSRHVESSWLRKSFRTAEERAGVPHVYGRLAYGVRRLGVDVGDAAGLSPSGLQALGGWTDIAIPERVYKERGNKAGRREARGVRATLRGEDSVTQELRV